MAGSSFLVLNDDIASILDDVAVMSKVAVKITAGVLGDDLTLNALQVAAMTNNITQPAFLRFASSCFKESGSDHTASHFRPGILTSVQGDCGPVNFCDLCVTFISIRYERGWCDGPQTGSGMGTNNTALIDPGAVMEEVRLLIRYQAFVRVGIKALCREE